MVTFLQKRTQTLRIDVSQLTKSSKKLMKSMPKAEKQKIFSAIESFCVEGTQSPCYHSKHQESDRAYLKPMSRSKYRIIITHEEIQCKATCHTGVVYIQVIIPRKELVTWLKNS